MSAKHDFTKDERGWQSVTMSKDSQGPGRGARKPFRQSSQSKGRQDLIGRELRRLFSDVVNEPLPDTFKDLLKQIEEERAPGGVDDALPVDGQQKSRK